MIWGLVKLGTGNGGGTGLMMEFIGLGRLVGWLGDCPERTFEGEWEGGVEIGNICNVARGKGTYWI